MHFCYTHQESAVAALTMVVTLKRIRAPSIAAKMLEREKKQTKSHRRHRFAFRVTRYPI